MSPMVNRTSHGDPRDLACRRPLPAARRGSALVVVLWVVALLSMFVLAFAFDMQIEGRIASSWRKKLKAEYLARAGLELARMALLETADPDVNNTDHTIYQGKGSDKDLRNAVIALAQGGGADLSRPLGEGSLALHIRPENARMSINSMVFVDDREKTYQAWDPLFETVGVSQDKRDALVDCLLDWVDPNELSHLNGVESGYYESLEPPYKCKNGPLDTVDELMLVKGYDEPISATSSTTVYEAVAPFLTTYSADQKINLNGVDAETLMAFLGIDAALAEEIISERLGPDGLAGTEDDKPFKDMNDLAGRVPGMNAALADRVTFSAQGRFSIQSQGRAGDITRTVNCVVSLSDKMLTILNWVEGDLPSSVSLIH